MWVIKLKPKQKCEFPGCTNQPTTGINGHWFCLEHFEESMNEIIEGLKQLPGIYKQTQPDQKTCTVRGGWCLICYITNTVCPNFKELPTPQDRKEHHTFYTDLIERLNE